MLRRLVADLGEESLPRRFADLQTGNKTEIGRIANANIEAGFSC
jgi:hypothetical protein